MPYAIERLAPTLGQHNGEVLRELFGLSDRKMAKLRDAEIIATHRHVEEEQGQLAAE